MNLNNIYGLEILNIRFNLSKECDTNGFLLINFLDL